jgi:hypothetical protein
VIFFSFSFVFANSDLYQKSKDGFRRQNMKLSLKPASLALRYLKTSGRSVEGGWEWKEKDDICLAVRGARLLEAKHEVSLIPEHQAEITETGSLSSNRTYSQVAK